MAVSVDAREEALAVVRDGLERKRALHLHYYVPTRDERTERTVDPMRLLLVDGKWYLEAWCRRAEGVRLFRLDRVDDVVVLDEPAAPPPQAHERDVDNGVYQPDPDSPAVRLRLARSARWVADYYPVDSVPPVDDPPGGLAVTVRTADLAWARRLVASLGGEAGSTSPPTSPRRWPPTPGPRWPATASTAQPARPVRLAAALGRVVGVARARRSSSWASSAYGLLGAARPAAPRARGRRAGPRARSSTRSQATAAQADEVAARRANRR